MRIKIVSDGTVHGTKIVNEDTGELLSGVQQVHWKVQAGDSVFAEATIHVINVPVEMSVDAEVAHAKVGAGG